MKRVLLGFLVLGTGVLAFGEETIFDPTRPVSMLGQRSSRCSGILLRRARRRSCLGKGESPAIPGSQRGNGKTCGRMRRVLWKEERREIGIG